MRVTKTMVTRTCAVCERTLLMGEHAFRFTSDGSEFVDVCPLCQETALDYGWVREGLAVSPTLQAGTARRRRRSKTLWQSLLGAREEEAEPVVSEPILRRLSNEEAALVEAAELYNASTFRRTIAGVGRSLGPPDCSVVPLSGISGEVVLTFAWDISWYQYRVQPEAAQPVRIADRGYDRSEHEPSFTEWNAAIEPDGRLVPDVARL
jgi:hypothetical protein